MPEEIIAVIDNALAMAGYKIMDGGSDKEYEYLVVRNAEADRDFEVRVTELLP